MVGVRKTFAILSLLVVAAIPAFAGSNSLEFVYNCFIDRFADGNPAWKTEITLGADLDKPPQPPYRLHYHGSLGYYTYRPKHWSELNDYERFAPDLLGRLTYRNDGFEFVTRGLLRELSIRTAGTAFEPPAVSDNAIGWGLASHARMPMRWLSDAFGADEVTGMAFYGKGIGRYNQVSTFGQDAISNIGLPGVASASLDPLETYGFTGVYRRFWTTQLRSNVEYSYARQAYPSYALGFIPGSTAAIFLNSNIQQLLANLIWSPFASFNNGVFGSGWLDVGLEYLYTQRGVFGGGAATWPTGAGYGVSNRVLGAVTAQF